MDGNQGPTQVLERSTGRTRMACLVEGCSCKDPRIVSQRRAAFYASIARENGETADRVVAADPTWRLPDPTAAA
jgi:hypothetical protein